MTLENRTTRIWLALGLASVLAWVIFLATAGQVFKLGTLAPPDLRKAGDSAPIEFDWTLLDLDGNPVDFAGSRTADLPEPLVRPGCGPCIEEMPTIANLAANPEVKRLGVAFLCVSVDESAAAPFDFARGKPWEMTILRATSIPPVFQAEGIPATFLIAPDGRIVSSFLGSARWDDPTVIEFLAGLPRPAG